MLLVVVTLSFKKKKRLLLLFQNILETQSVFSPLRLTKMMTKGVMRIRPEETGLINWILFCPWLAMQWDWETCGGFLILPSKTGEVRLYVCVF